MPAAKESSNYIEYRIFQSRNTLLADVGDYIKTQIDYCLVSPEIKVANIHTGIDTGSVHAPIVVDLVIPTA